MDPTRYGVLYACLRACTLLRPHSSPPPTSHFCRRHFCCNGCGPSQPHPSLPPHITLPLLGPAGVLLCYIGPALLTPPPQMPLQAPLFQRTAWCWGLPAWSYASLPMRPACCTLPCVLPCATTPRSCTAGRRVRDACAALLTHAQAYATMCAVLGNGSLGCALAGTSVGGARAHTHTRARTHGVRCIWYLDPYPPLPRHHAAHWRVYRDCTAGVCGEGVPHARTCVCYCVCVYVWCVCTVYVC